MTRTPSRTRTRTTRSSEHTARRPVDAHEFIHRTCGSRLPRVCHPCHPCMRTCGWCLELSVFFLVSFVFYLVSPFFFQPFLMSNSAPNERSMSNPCATPAWGAWSHPTTSHPSQEVHERFVPRIGRVWRWMASMLRQPAAVKAMHQERPGKPIKTCLITIFLQRVTDSSWSLGACKFSQSCASHSSRWHETHNHSKLLLRTLSVPMFDFCGR